MAARPGVQPRNVLCPQPALDRSQGKIMIVVRRGPAHDLLGRRAACLRPGRRDRRPEGVLLWTGQVRHNLDPAARNFGGSRRAPGPGRGESQRLAWSSADSFSMLISAAVRLAPAVMQIPDGGQPVWFSPVTDRPDHSGGRQRRRPGHSAAGQRYPRRSVPCCPARLSKSTQGEPRWVVVRGPTPRWVCLRQSVGSTYEVVSACHHNEGLGAAATSAAATDETRGLPAGVGYGQAISESAWLQRGGVHPDALDQVNWQAACWDRAATAAV
jgi:hypothetical protein